MAQHEFTTTRRVEFNETDAAGIVHFSNFYRYMEYAEHAFFRSLGRSIADAELEIGWPRVHSHCDYKKPLKFEDEVEINLLVSDKTSKSITYQFRFRVDNAEVARGGFTVVCVRLTEAGEMKAASIPPEIAALIEAAPEEKLAG